MEIADNAFGLHEDGKANAKRKDGLSSNTVAITKAGDRSRQMHIKLRLLEKVAKPKEIKVSCHGPLSCNLYRYLIC